MKLAVYGTLRKGSDSVDRIENTALVYPGHQRFPAMIRDASGGGTIVEVHEVDGATLIAYDHYEGVPTGVYRREIMKVVMDDGTMADAWVYLAGEKLLEQRKSFVAITSGDWFDR